MRLRSLLAWFPLVGLFAACGSDESSGGATGNTCAAGATQTCTCSGTDTGVQVCAADGKSWGACDCGGSGGTGGGGGDASTGGGSGGTGASSGTGAVSGGGTAGVAGDGSTDGGSNSDPCPTEPVDVDCSSDCGGPEPQCSNPNPCINLLFQSGIDLTAKPKHVFRTASPPQQQAPNCCGSPSSPGYNDYGQYKAETPQGLGLLYKVTVGKPWLVSFSEDGSGNCGAPQAQGCAVSTGKGTFRISTPDPNAGARNITVEALPGFPTCAPSEYWQ